MNRLRNGLPSSVVISTEGEKDDAFTKTPGRLNGLRSGSKMEQLELNFEFIPDQENQEKVYSTTFPTTKTPEEFNRLYKWYHPDSVIEPKEDVLGDEESSE